MSAGAKRSALHGRIMAALRDAGLRELRVSVYPAGAVVDDGQTLWTCRAGDLLSAARKVAKKDSSALRGADKLEALCNHTQYLARGDERERADHERLVRAWRRETGLTGNWA